MRAGPPRPAHAANLLLGYAYTDVFRGRAGAPVSRNCRFPRARIRGRISRMDDRPVQTMEPGPTELAVENERLQRALRARLEEEQALRRVATLVARQHAPEAALALVTEEVARHLHASAAATVRYDDPDHATVVATWTAPGVASFTLGRQIEIVAGTALAAVQRTRAPARVDSYEGVEGVVPQALRERGARAAVASPIFVDGDLWGAFVLASREKPFAAAAEARLGAFTELVAQAIANVDARIRLQESRTRIVEATYEARRRIERDLHDGAQQRLSRSRCRWRSSPGPPSPPPRQRSRAASRSCRRRSRSCASSRAAFIRPCSPSAVSSPPSSRLPRRRPFPSSSTPRSIAVWRQRTRRRCTSSRRRR